MGIQTKKSYILKILKKYHTLIDFEPNNMKIRMIRNPEETKEGHRTALVTNIPLYISYIAMYVIWDRYYERLFGIALDIILYLSMILIFSHIYFHYQSIRIFDPRRLRSESIWENVIAIKPQGALDNSVLKNDEHIIYIGILFIDYDSDESKDIIKMEEDGIILNNLKLTNYTDRYKGSIRWYNRFFLVAGITNHERLFPVLPKKYYFDHMKKERGGFAISNIIRDFYEFTMLVKEIYSELNIEQNLKFDGGMLFNLMEYNYGNYRPVFVNPR